MPHQPKCRGMMTPAKIELKKMIRTTVHSQFLSFLTNIYSIHFFYKWKQYTWPWSFFLFSTKNKFRKKEQVLLWIILIWCSLLLDIIWNCKKKRNWKNLSGRGLDYIEELACVPSLCTDFFWAMIICVLIYYEKYLF